MMGWEVWFLILWGAMGWVFAFVHRWRCNQFRNALAKMVFRRAMMDTFGKFPTGWGTARVKFYLSKEDAEEEAWVKWSEVGEDGSDEWAEEIEEVGDGEEDRR